MEQKPGFLFKVLVLGELATGKTALIKRSVQNIFTEKYRATIGVDFALKIVTLDDNTVVRLQLWDIGGQERVGNMTRVYYKEAVGCFIVFDATRGSTFEGVARWKKDVDQKVILPNGNPIPCVLLANKCDLVKDGFSNKSEEMDAYCRENGFVKWFETSAKKNTNIEASVRFLISEMMKCTTAVGAEEATKTKTDGCVSVTDENMTTKLKRGCCGGGA